VPILFGTVFAATPNGGTIAHWVGEPCVTLVLTGTVTIALYVVFLYIQTVHH